MRLISFSLTTEQFIARTKTVTRRLGWKTLKAGDCLMGVEKAMGLKPGEKVKRLGAIKVISARLEPLDAITPADVIREGFHGMTPEEFVAMFCRGMRCTPKTEVTRIEFEYLEGST